MQHSRLISVSRMMEMMLTGRSYDAAEGQAIGLTHYLTAAGAGLAKALELAERIAQNVLMSNRSRWRELQQRVRDG